MTKYKIQVKTFQNTIITFNVDSYNVLPGDLIEFIDTNPRTGEKKIKQFHLSNCEIEKIPEGGI